MLQWGGPQFYMRVSGKPQNKVCDCAPDGSFLSRNLDLLACEKEQLQAIMSAYDLKVILRCRTVLESNPTVLGLAQSSL
jgi:hypothetical protein